jgi:hypothetical protein
VVYHALSIITGQSNGNCISLRFNGIRSKETMTPNEHNNLTDTRLRGVDQKQFGKYRRLYLQLLFQPLLQ